MGSIWLWSCVCVDENGIINIEYKAFEHISYGKVRVAHY